MLLSIIPGLIIMEIVAGLWNTRRSPVIAFYFGLGIPVLLVCCWFLTRVWSPQPIEGDE